MFQVKQAEADEVMGAAVDLGGDGMVGDKEGHRISVTIVADRLVGFESGTDVDRGMGHAERQEHLRLHELPVRSTRDLGDNMIY